MESLRSFKSRDMPLPRSPKRFRLTAVLLACVVFSQGARNASAQENRRVLVLHEQGRSATAVASIDREIREVFEKQANYQIDLYVEYMDANLFVDPVSRQRILDGTCKNTAIISPT
jgi:hypothetical protein